MIQIDKLKMTCSACPSQWEGTLSDGREIYIRFRWGCLSAGIGDSILDAVDNSMKDETGPDSYYRGVNGLSFDGEMTSTEMLAEIVPWLETIE